MYMNMLTCQLSFVRCCIIQ